MTSPEYFYQPTDLEDELFITEVPVNILIGSIESQFQEPLEYKKRDYVQAFIDKYNFSKQNMLEDDQNDVELYRDQFVAFLKEKFDEYLSIGFPDFDDKEQEESHEILHLVYRFFLKNIKKNFVHIIMNYLDEHKSELLSSYDLKKRDVTTLNFKAELNDDEDVLILANLRDLIDHILDIVSNIDDIFEFFRLCEGDEADLELIYVKKLFEDMEVTGNFIPSYCAMIDDNFRIELQSKIRSKILKKYPKRTKNDNVSSDDLLENEDAINEDEVDESTK